MEKFIIYSICTSSITYRVGEILLSFLATQQKIDELLKINWHDPSSGRSENKQNMKILGVSVIRYKKLLKEMTVIAVSKSIEDLINDVNEYLSKTIKFWEIVGDPVYYIEMKMIRSMNNCIKHSSEIVKDNVEPSNRYLIDECGIKPNFPLEYYNMDYETIILKNFLFQFDLSSKLMNFKNPWTNINESNIRKIRNYLIPSILKLG